jgi:hypothetical protein
VQIDGYTSVGYEAQGAGTFDPAHPIVVKITGALPRTPEPTKEGSKSVSSARLVRIACIVAAVLAAVTLISGTASASGVYGHAWVDDPWFGYTYPIQMVYHFPATIVSQPGEANRFVRSDLSGGNLGGQPYLYHH